MKRIDPENNATTALDPRVIDSMQEALISLPLNPSSTHLFGQEAKKKLVSTAKEKIAHALHTNRPRTFTSGGTEAINHLLRGHHALSPHCHIITSNVEHPSVLPSPSSKKRPHHLLPPRRPLGRPPRLSS